MTETKNNYTSDVAERVMELFGSILQETKERIVALRDEQRKLSTRMTEALLKQDDDEAQWTESRHSALTEQIEHLSDGRGHAISDLDGAVVDPEVVYQEAAAGASAVEARAHRLKNSSREILSDGWTRRFSRCVGTRSRCLGTVVEELAVPEGAGVEISLYQAVPKGGRMDLVVEKATEVGATRIVPLLTERGLVNPREGKVGRWRRVAEAAARQSLRLSVPEVADPVPFEDAASKVREGGVLLHTAPDLHPVEAIVQPPVSLFVGPEGGWSEGELRLAEETGIVFGGLGAYRLRSETAGMVAVARTLAALESRVEYSRRWP